LFSVGNRNPNFGVIILIDLNLSNWNYQLAKKAIFTAIYARKYNMLYDLESNILQNCKIKKTFTSSYVLNPKENNLLSPSSAITILQHWAYHNRLVPAIKSFIENTSKVQSNKESKD
jgi:hypothetical protein